MMTVLSSHSTPIGKLALVEEPLGGDRSKTITLIRLNGEILMSDVNHFSEAALADEAIKQWGSKPCRVLNGGLGMGYTAQAALKHSNVSEVVVVEFLPEVIQWHEVGALPIGNRLACDLKVEFILGDFFAHMGFNAHPGYVHDIGKFDVILLDIDDAPSKPIASAHGAFYTPDGLRGMADRLNPGGVCAVWSYGPQGYEQWLPTFREVFPDGRIHRVPHFDMHREQTITHVLYIGTKP